MRTKVIFLVTVIAALAVGVTASNASLQQSLSVNVNFKKAGGPGNFKVSFVNVEDGGLVPERIARMVITSKSVKYNSKALPYCKIIPTGSSTDTIPTNAAGNNNSEFLAPEPGQSNAATVLKNCPLKSLVGKGTFEAVVGNVRQAYDPSAAGLVTGKVFLYNYKPRSGDQAAMVAWVQSDNPVPNANQYLYVGVSKAGVINSVLPNRSDIPTKISDLLPQGVISMTKLSLTLTAPKPAKKNGKPLFTIKNFSKLDVKGELVRD